MKAIIVKKCIECLKIKTCSQWAKLTAEQKFAIKFSTDVGSGILKTCKLPDFEEPK